MLSKTRRVLRKVVNGFRGIHRFMIYPILAASASLILSSKLGLNEGLSAVLVLGSIVSVVEFFRVLPKDDLLDKTSLGWVATFALGVWLFRPANFSVEVVYTVCKVILATGITLYTPLLLKSLISVNQEMKVERDAQAHYAKERAEHAEFEEIKAKLLDLTNNNAVSQGFLEAVTRLTQYVPDVGTSLLEAAVADHKRLKVLEAYIATTNNDVVKKSAKKEAAQIHASARASCEQLTQEVLEMIYLEESQEANRTLGDESVPQLEVASRAFNDYLVAYRETRRITSASRTIGEDAELASEIEGLGTDPEPKVVEMPVAKNQRIPRGGGITYN